MRRVIYSTKSVNASSKSYADRQTVEDKQRARTYTAALYPDYDQDRLDALLDINWNDVTSRDSEGFLLDLANFPDLGAIDSVRYVSDKELNDTIYPQGYDGGFFVKYADGDYGFFAWKDNDNNLYPVDMIVDDVEGCDAIMNAVEIDGDEISFRDWLSQRYWEGFNPSDLSDEEFFELEDQYRAEVPKAQRERNYR